MLLMSNSDPTSRNPESSDHTTILQSSNCPVLVNKSQGAQILPEEKREQLQPGEQTPFQSFNWLHTYSSRASHLADTGGITLKRNVKNALKPYYMRSSICQNKSHPSTWHSGSTNLSPLRWDMAIFPSLTSLILRCETPFYRYNPVKSHLRTILIQTPWNMRSENHVSTPSCQGLFPNNSVRFSQKCIFS